MKGLKREKRSDKREERGHGGTLPQYIMYEYENVMKHSAMCNANKNKYCIFVK